jgi:hypothetical protein
MHSLVGDPHLRRRIARLRARVTLDLAGFYADFDRSAAARTLAKGCLESGTLPQWWTGLPRKLLKVLLPSGLLGAYRDFRTAR